MSASKVNSFIFIIISSQLVCDSSSTVKLNQIKPESLELVQQIKADLRKNNDDYADMKPRNDTPKDAVINSSPTPPISPDVRPENKLDERKLKVADKIRRRMYGLDQAEQTFSKVTPIMKTKSGGILQFRSFTQHQDVKQLSKKYLRKDKLKKFIQQNRAKIKKYRVRKRPKKALKGPGLRQGSLEEQAAAEGPELPANSQLDLAPAHGARVQMLRLKGRLCQRSVLVPEGPKYDSRGAVYLPAHALPQPYPRTRPPPLLLPRCCNCCKKSALGCE